jgi:hypothetical protein
MVLSLGLAGRPLSRSGQDLPSGIAAVVGVLMTLGILSRFPQGIVALVLGSVRGGGDGVDN